ncbi:MAG: ATP-grasp domain-containing protein, partial [Deferribacteraceae bacterium]|nr:ATP-grasp domain-containing protein [Deferribacteraceae bacterium]
GFTYDLKDDYLKLGYSKEEAAEFDSLLTISAICSAVEKAGHTIERIGNVDVLYQKLLGDNSAIINERWDFVFNICEGLRGSGRESLVPALLDSYQIPYTFSDPLTHAITLNKAVTKRLLKSEGIATTDFVLISSLTELDSMNLSYPCFVKPVSEGTGKGITPKSKVHNKAELAAQVTERLKQFKQPVLVEPFLTGREVTVGVLGTGANAFCLGVMNVGFTDKADSDIHSYYNKENCEFAAVYTPAKDEFAAKCADLALRAHRLLDIKDACRVDIRADEHGEPQIMEINSLPGLMPGRSDLILLAEMFDYSYQQVIEAIIKSAVERQLTT